ncbi:hypothetical protein ACHHYP_08346 [Achlya hypogyna]|uniref:Monopolin complex subunit Csm1/Pcs1 C-terminal domain-containing protein n=1 Tax=Achlya hypogyna TaxID=1202772 RepID=A0A1V9ZKN9_ACHHY|nr:hypothetical protein ACHHYP_08346 [Achlya hypogyna]
MARSGKDKAISYTEWETPLKGYGSENDSSDAEDARPLKKPEAKKAKPSAKSKPNDGAVDPPKKKRPLEVEVAKKVEPAKKAEKRQKASPKSDDPMVGPFVAAVKSVLLTADGDKDAKAALKKLRRDYAELVNVRQTEPEKLLEESRRLAKAEADAHDKATAKLKQEVANLTKKLDKYERIREDLERAKAKNATGKSASPDELDALQLKYDQLRAENSSLRIQLEETQVPPVGTANASVSEMHAKLAHTNKLLRIYELISSLHVTLKKDGDVQEVSCRVLDSLRAQQFAFDLAIPTNPRKQIDYVPSPDEVAYHKHQAEPSAPSYLLEDLSFSRSELTRFMRTMLDAVIRKPT